MSKIEEMQSAATEAEREARHQHEALRALTAEMQLTGPGLSCTAYGNLRASIQQQEQRATAASERAAKLQAEVDVLRDRKNAKLRRDLALKAIEDTECRLREAQTEFNVRHAEFIKIQSELPVIQSKASLLMFELSKLRDDLQRFSA